MHTKEEVYALAEHWAEAWNAHDLDQIMAHYEEDVVLISLVAAQILGAPDGKVSGKANVRAYFQKGIGSLPGTSLQSEEHPMGCRERRSVLRQSKGNAYS